MSIEYHEDETGRKWPRVAKSFESPALDPIQFIDAMVLLIKSNRKLEMILADLCKIAIEINAKAWGNPPDYEFRLRMKTGVYVGMAPDPRAAILVALKQARAALGEAKNAE